MKKIDKGSAPKSLQHWTKQQADIGQVAGYKRIFAKERWDILADIINACIQEQFFLCAYCCQRISGSYTDTRAEHVVARRLAPKRSLDFANIVASCKTPHQCDAAHGSQPLPLTPLMPECETELRFMLSGRVEGITQRAKMTIDVLNLGDKETNNRALIHKRKHLIEALIWRNYGADPKDLVLEDDKMLIDLLIDDLQQPIDGKLEAFSPVLINILNQLLTE